MGMYRILCQSCGWHTKPHYSIIDCVKEKKWAHQFGICEKRYDAHDSAFGTVCPKCGRETKEEWRYFSNDEIKEDNKMNKPNNYDETKVGGEFTPIILGGHHMVIKNVEETTSKAGKPMLKVSFDFAKNDSQPEYMMNEYKNDIRPDKKWPHAGTQYILTEDKEGKCARSFKSFITAFEASNKCEAIWGEKFAAQFKNKKIGGVFGKVENEYNGKITMRHELRWFCADDKADGADIPADKLLPVNNGATSSAMIPDDLVNTNNEADEVIPF